MKITAKVTGKRQITIPLKICELCSIKNGDNVVFSRKNNEIIFSKEVNTMICPICNGKGLIETINKDERECFFCQGEKEISITSDNPVNLIIRAMSNSKKYKMGISFINQKKNEDDSITILDKPLINIYANDLSSEKIKEIENKLQNLINKEHI